MHNWYDWVKDIALPLLTGGGSVVVGLAALRVARRGHELAAASEEREGRLTRFDARQRVATELFDLVRVREFELEKPTDRATASRLALMNVTPMSHMNNRAEVDIIAAASTLAAVLEGTDRLGFDWLLNLLQELLRPANRGHIPVMATTAKLSIEQWARDPAVFLERMRGDWSRLDPS